MLKETPKFLRLYFGIVGAVSVILIAYLFVGLESYCVIYPEIDTRYAAGFTERAFSKVKTGMTEAEITALLGTPLGTLNLRSGTQWHYTQDGKCRWADWAWLGRIVVFENGRVSEKISCVYYD